MAVLRRATGVDGIANEYIGDLPLGAYEAICIDIHERLNVERKKYQSEEMERVDLIAFEFEVAGRSGVKRSVRSREMRISTHEKSALHAFLSAWLGAPPKTVWIRIPLWGARPG